MRRRNDTAPSAAGCNMPRKHRRRSWGSITEKVKGKKYVLRWVENTDDGRKRRSKTFYGTYKEACRHLAVYEVRHGDEKRVPTIGEAYEAWYIPWLERQVADGKKKQSTADRYTELWDSLAGSRWGKVPLDRVKPAQLQEWLLGLSKGNANISMVLLRKIGDLALRNDIVQHNVFRRDYDMPTLTTRKKKLDVYDLETAKQVLSLLDGTVVKAPYIISCFGGARVGESCGVQCREVRLAEHNGMTFAIVPIVRRMPKTGSYPLRDGDLKTPQSKRETIIPAPYCFELMSEIELRNESGSIWVADRGDGLPLNENSYMYWFKVAVGDMAIPLSNLRASWRTIAQFEWGIPSDTLEVLMGHVLQGVSGKHYIRPSTDDLVQSFAEHYRFS